MVACTLVFEGERGEVEVQRKTLARLAKRHGGMLAGGENGASGYQLTFAIAYIRDFMARHWVLAESFETSVPWSKVESLCDRVKARIRDEHARRGLPGQPFVSCRVTQLYETGACVYFYSAFHHKGVERPMEVYAAIEHAAREEILACGGSLSHHHGIGKLREGFMAEILSPAGLAWQEHIKRGLDPTDVFGIGNQRVEVTHG
jgi:alkyldihydroxyacetonephosphate synthase